MIGSVQSTTPMAHTPSALKQDDLLMLLNSMESEFKDYMTEKSWPNTTKCMPG